MISATVLLLSTLLAQAGAPAPKAAIPTADRRLDASAGTDTHFQFPAYPSTAAWKTRREQLRKQILSAAGLLPLPTREPVPVRMMKRSEHGGFAVERLLLETLPGYHLGATLYRPLGQPGKRPAVLTPHGHWKNGRIENSDEFSGPALGITLAKQGYISLAWDMVGYNDTKQTPHAFGESTREQLWNFGPLSLQLWNSLRALDYVASLPDVDAARIGITGASGGGTQAFLLTAIDDRIAAAAPVNMVSAIMQGGSPCENAAGLRVDAYNVEFAAITAPRPLLLVAATGDWTRNVPREEYLDIKRIYTLFDVPERVETVQFDYPHNFNRDSREAVYRFFAKHLNSGASADTLWEKPLEWPDPKDLLSLQDQNLPPGSLDFEGVFTAWRAITLREAAKIDSSELRRTLLEGLLLEWPAEAPQVQIDGERIALTRPGRGDRVPGVWMAGSGGKGKSKLLVVHPDGAEVASSLASVGEAKRSGRPVLLLDVFQTGSAAKPPTQRGRFHLTFHRSDAANRLQDLLTAIRWLSADGSRVELAGIGDAAVWAVFAAALAPAKVELRADLTGFNGSDAAFARHLMVPGIQRLGGLDSAKRLLSFQRVRWQQSIR